MASYRELLVKVGADTQGLSSGLKGASASFLGLSSSAAAAAAVAAAAVAAIGAAAFKVGLDFEQANKSIRIGTGATGEALEDLKESAKSVFVGVPESIGQVSETLAALNTTTGLTGSELESLTSTVLDLQRLNTGFAGDVTTLTRAFGDWSIKSNETSDALDFLFKTSQATNVGVDELAQKVVQIGAPLRALGFGFEESAALMGKWGKEGVNTETVMSGLRMAVANLGKDGGDVPAKFRGVIESIQEVGRGSEASAISLKAFGQTAANDMADAILGGKFSVDELVASIDASQDTIAGAAAETATLGDKFAELSNKAMVFLEPLGSFLVDVLGAGLSFVIDMFDAWWTSTSAFLDLIGVSALPSLTDFSGGIKGIADAIRDFFIAQMVKGMESTAAFLETLSKFPLIGDKFKGKAEGIRTAINKMKGVIAETAKEIGTPEKPKSFTGSVKKAEVVVFDFEKALKEADKKTGDFEKGLKSATKDGVDKFYKALKNDAIPEVKGLDRASGRTSLAVLRDLKDMTAGTLPLITKLEDIPTRTKDVESAFASLQTKGTSELQRLYDSARQNFNLIQDSGEATPRQISEAWKIELDAQKALLEAQGKELSQEEADILADLNRKLEAGTKVMETTWGIFATNVGSTISTLGETLFKDLLEGKFSLSTVTDALRAIKDAFATALFAPVKSAIDSFITNSIDKLIGKLTGPGGLSGALGTVFGGGSGGGGLPGIGGTGGGGGIPTGGGGGGGIGGALGSAASGGGGGGLGGALGSMASGGAVGMVTGAVSAVSGVVSNFQFAAMNKSLDLIETAVRRVDIGITQPGGLLPHFNDYAHIDEWDRHKGLIATLESNGTATWDQHWSLVGALQTQTGDIKPMVDETTRAVQDVALRVAALADRTIEIILDGDKVAEAVSRRLANQLAAA